MAGTLEAPSKLEPPAAPPSPEVFCGTAKLFNPPKPPALVVTGGSGVKVFPAAAVEALALATLRGEA